MRPFFACQSASSGCIYAADRRASAKQSLVLSSLILAAKYLVGGGRVAPLHRRETIRHRPHGNSSSNNASEGGGVRMFVSGVRGPSCPN